MGRLDIWSITMIIMLVVMFLSFGIGVALIVWFIKKIFNRK